MIKSAKPRVDKTRHPPGTQQSAVNKVCICPDVLPGLCSCGGGEGRWDEAGFRVTVSGYVLDPGDLDHPCHVGAVDAVLHEPGGEFAPLLRTAAIDGQAGLGMLVLGLHQVCTYLLQSQERSPSGVDTCGV